ncbi:hypothetical protein I4U23_010610 [Adineta vaga]|nr:hypothetical protein I4U23_010610 [Adineta vaga]
MDVAYKYMNEADISKELICSICQSPFQNPCCTPCGDTFCNTCITDWIQASNNSCPLCRCIISINTLTQVPRALRNILDQLPVKCIACGQTEIQRVNIDEHIQKSCPKKIVVCLAADITCPWIGPQDQLNIHLLNCRFEPVRSIITELMEKNHHSEEQRHEYMTQIVEQVDEIEYLRDKVHQQGDEIRRHENQIGHLREQVARLSTQANTHEQDERQLQAELRRKNNQIESLTIELQEQQARIGTRIRTLFDTCIGTCSRCNDCTENVRWRHIYIFVFTAIALTCIIAAVIFGVRHQNTTDIYRAVSLFFGAIFCTAAALTIYCLNHDT